MRHIVAIEIGSSKIKGALASVDSDTTLNVLAVEEMPVDGIVRHGRVQNVQEVANTIRQIIQRLEQSPDISPASISMAYISYGGRSYHSVATTGTLHMPTETQITEVSIKRLIEEARYNIATGYDVDTLLPKLYKVDNTAVANVVGTYGNTLYGEFTALVCAPDNKRNIDRVKITSTTGREIKRAYVARIVALCDMLMTNDDRQRGCLLADCGAETTTVAIYKGGVLLHVATLPIGGNNITMDLCAAMNMTHDNAELNKRSKGVAMVDRDAGETTDKSALDINDIVQPRAGEIAANIINQIAIAGIKITDLGAGIIISGGAAALTNFDLLIKKQCGLEVRCASADLPGIAICNRYVKASEHIDVISLMLYAARNFADDCVAMPAETAPEPRVETFAAPVGPEPAPAGRRQPDEDTLLEDDDYDDDHATATAKRKAEEKKNKNKKHRKAEEEQQRYRAEDASYPGNAHDEPDGTDDDGTDDDDTDDDDTSKRLGLLSRLGRKVTDFFTTAPDDDMD